MKLTIHQCPVCTKRFEPEDMCSTDIELGTCHAACLKGTPTVDLDTGEQVDGPIPTYPYSELEPQAAKIASKLTDRQQKLLAALCECPPGKGSMLGPEARRVAGPLISAGYLMWLGFGKIRVYSATEAGRTALGPKG